MSNEPTTEAGRALLDDWRNDGPTYNFRERIIAIEDEARSIAESLIVQRPDAALAASRAETAECQEYAERLDAAWDAKYEASRAETAAAVAALKRLVHAVDAEADSIVEPQAKVNLIRALTYAADVHTNLTAAAQAHDAEVARPWRAWVQDSAEYLHYQLNQKGLHATKEFSECYVDRCRDARALVTNLTAAK